MKPIIGLFVTVDNNKITNANYTYSRAVTELGGTPIVMPYSSDDADLDNFISLCDGFLFSGGKDVEPKRFNEEQLKYISSQILSTLAIFDMDISGPEINDEHSANVR